jgi:hypothetical protein
MGGVGEGRAITNFSKWEIEVVPAKEVRGREEVYLHGFENTNVVSGQSKFIVSRNNLQNS